ncbi:MAG: hypothetical protein ACRDFY_06765 [Candidatus Limnocylindria bacterium]
MTLATRRRSRTPVSEEAVAAARVVLGLTIGVGLMAAAMGAATEGPIVVIALPTLVLLAAVARGMVPLAGWAGVAVWAVLLPPAHDEALLAPLAMIVLCLAIAIGPERMLSWIGRDAVGQRDADARGPQGWIEEDGRPVD